MGAKVSQFFAPEKDRPVIQVISEVRPGAGAFGRGFAVVAAGAALLLGLAACASPGVQDRKTTEEQPTPVVSASQEPSATPSPSATTASATPTPTPTPTAITPPVTPPAASGAGGAADVVGGNVPAPLVKVPVPVRNAPPAPAPRPAPPAPKPVVPAPAPKPVAPPKPVVPAPAPPASYYGNCSAARAAGAAPLYAGQPGYRPGLDRDKDGVACE
jgi:Excalibur calcium-binding domain